jgi:hypothetical protein
MNFITLLIGIPLGVLLVGTIFGGFIKGRSEKDKKDFWIMISVVVIGIYFITTISGA